MTVHQTLVHKRSGDQMLSEQSVRHVRMKKQNKRRKGDRLVVIYLGKTSFVDKRVHRRDASLGCLCSQATAPKGKDALRHREHGL